MEFNMSNLFALPSFVTKLVGAQGDDSSDDQFNEPSSSESEDNSLEVDSNTYNTAVVQESASSTNKFSSNANISVEDVQQIEGDLDVYEIISLIFLLYDTNLALQAIHIIVHAYDISNDLKIVNDKLSNWARCRPSNWKPMMIEALAVVQNYKVLKKLGYERKEVDEWCLPMTDTSLFISRSKKMLYRLCESLDEDKSTKLIDLVYKDKQFDNNITNGSNTIFLEYFILFWISREYLKLPDNGEICLKNLIKHLKVIDFYKSEEIEGIIRSINNEMRIDSTDLKNATHGNEDIYTIINPSLVGLCIIIDMFKFQKDKRKEFQDSVSKDNLSDRNGTSYDVESLTKTLTHSKFRVQKLENISHDCLQEEIQNAIKLHFKPDYSVFVLCILSHGSKGSIYAANCVAVSIQEIQSYVSGPSAREVENLLANKPKVIIVQACQGNQLLYVNPAPCLSNQLNNVEQNQLQMDGPEKFTPNHSDVLVCMAIIEGYMAVRGTRQGTKYIQELCRCLKKYYLDEHFLEIIIRVHASLNAEEMHVPVPEEYSNCTDRSHKNCANVYMTPVMYSTLRKKLYLVPKS